ncbi:MAG: O-antigen ligase family protein [Ruminiclostridium sp.]|nr:O-antigen ligase family protein [Ruminiclostridium sp.]
MEPLQIRMKIGFFYAAAGILGLLYLILAVNDVILATMFSLTIAAVYLFYRYSDLSFITLLLILPFLGLGVFNESMAGIPGLRPQILLVPLVVLFFIIKKKPYSIPAGLIVSIFMILTLFTVSFFRSIEYASKISGRFINFSVYSYASTQFLSPIIIMLPLLLIPLYYQSEKEISRITTVLIASITIISACVIALYLFVEPMKLDLNHFRNTLSTMLGIHGNDLANFCFLAIPFLLVACLHKKNVWAYGALLLTLGATALSYSRTAYFIVLFGIVLFYFLSGRYKYLPIIAIVIFLVLQFVLPESIIDRALTGFSEGDLNLISAGRIQHLWQPILNEINIKPDVIWFGYGIHGIINLRAWQTGTIFAVSHAHNMYLDMILESGLIGLISLLAFYAYVLVKFIKSYRRRELESWQRDLLAAVIVAIICYLISGFTGRRLFPSLSNIYVWIVTGLGFSLVSAGKARAGLNPASWQSLMKTNEQQPNVSWLKNTKGGTGA